MGPPPHTTPPILLLGGEANALSVARELGRAGIPVFAVGEPDAAVRHSRYCRWIDLRTAGDPETAWADFLLGPASDHLRGAVVLACSDAGLRVLTTHRPRLLRRFRLDLCDPTAQLAMLDKLTTYEHALAAGVPAPQFWRVDDREQILRLKDSLVYPLLVKPRLSHLFEAHFGRKHVLASNFDDLLRAIDASARARTDVLLMEWIPGGDDHLCSYYTYLDEDGIPQFHFTKRIIRRYPSGMGTACYHVTDWLPDLVPLANRLFAHAGLRGLANVEFKLDPRDGQYKLIECNARFTASNRLVAAAGVPLATYVYNRLTGRPLPQMQPCRSGLRLWDPIRDYWSFLELRRQGGITTLAWLKSVLHRQTFAYFEWSDPVPAVARMFKPVRRRFRRLPRQPGRRGMEVPPARQADQTNPRPAGSVETRLLGSAREIVR